MDVVYNFESSWMPTSPVEPDGPRARPVQYATPLGTRWQKEKAAAGDGYLEFPEDPKSVGPWVLGECVGKGASGRVRIAQHRRTGELAAVKILPLTPHLNSRASLRTVEAKAARFRLGIDREIVTMKLMHHPNIMRIYDVFEGENALYLVLEYVEGGELFDFIVNRGKMAPAQALAYFKQIIAGLHYAHTFSIVHRDLKPENVLIQSIDPPLIKIADWGMAAFNPPASQLGTSCGSPHYASPEIVNGEKYRGPASDIWSCGVILFALLTGRLPFDDKDVRKLLAKVRVGQYELFDWIEPQARDLIARMLVVDVSKRITVSCSIPSAMSAQLTLPRRWPRSSSTRGCRTRRQAFRSTPRPPSRTSRGRSGHQRTSTETCSSLCTSSATGSSRSPHSPTRSSRQRPTATRASSKRSTTSSTATGARRSTRTASRSTCPTTACGVCRSSTPARSRARPSPSARPSAGGRA
jgi:serine/threonine protein kinase